LANQPESALIISNVVNRHRKNKIANKNVKKNNTFFPVGSIAEQERFIFGSVIGVG
jgi:hypothetical protein